MTTHHDMSAGGRLLELLTLCEEHKGRGDFNRHERLFNLIDQTRRIVDDTLRADMNRKTIELQIKAKVYEEQPA